MGVTCGHHGFPQFVRNLYDPEIYGSDVIKCDFFADAGMVCVCRLTASVMRQWKTKYDTTKLDGAAIFEMSEDIDVDFDQSCPDWTVITIKDNTTGHTISSRSAEDYYDELEYYNYYQDKD